MGRAAFCIASTVSQASRIVIDLRRAGFDGYAIPEFEAKRFGGKVVGGGILVSVHVEGRKARRRAYEVCARHGGEDIAVAEQARADFPVGEASRA